MMEFDHIEFGKAMGQMLRDATGPLLKRIEELEARQLVKGEDGQDGKDGSSVTLDDVAPIIAEQVKAAVGAIPVPQNGENGKDGADGKDADPVSVAEVAAELLATDGLKALVDLHVAEAVAALPKPENGKDGDPGLPGEPGEPGAKGDPGADGVGLAGAVIDREGALTLTLTNGETKSLGVIVGKDGENGTHGKDGLSFDNATGEFDAERGFVIRLANGERSAEFVLPYMRHAGFWSEGKAAKAGESMTHDGALYIAKRDTQAKPCAENGEDWILAARKGRDGNHGRNGIDKTGPVKV